MQVVQTSGGGDAKENEDSGANAQTVTATARIKNIIEDDSKAGVDAVELEVNGTIVVAEETVQQASKRCIVFGP